MTCIFSDIAMLLVDALKQLGSYTATDLMGTLVLSPLRQRSSAVALIATRADSCIAPAPFFLSPWCARYSVPHSKHLQWVAAIQRADAAAPMSSVYHRPSRSTAPPAPTSTQPRHAQQAPRTFRVPHALRAVPPPNARTYAHLGTTRTALLDIAHASVIASWAYGSRSHHARSPQRRPHFGADPPPAEMRITAYHYSASRSIKSLLTGSTQPHSLFSFYTVTKLPWCFIRPSVVYLTH
ncbi:hypothetical protein B0H13DRAFT_1883382 [Mycena leptocephala]|nr:hypothetical protein B0H13DRAFT_1883382 [Mycena leptocephala]